MNSRVFTCAILVLVFGAALPAAEPLSFRNDVLPVLSKVGCNSGGCHGSLAGKGGFRLSLNAYDPATDESAKLLFTQRRPWTLACFPETLAPCASSKLGAALPIT